MKEVKEAFIAAVSEEAADCILTNVTCKQMTARLTDQRNISHRHGWHTDICPSEHLKEQLLDCVTGHKSDLTAMLLERVKLADLYPQLVDIINLAAMINCRSMLYGEETELDESL